MLLSSSGRDWLVSLLDQATLMIPAVAIEVLPTIACAPSVELEIGLLMQTQQDSVSQGHVAIVQGEVCQGWKRLYCRRMF